MEWKWCKYTKHTHKHQALTTITLKGVSEFENKWYLLFKKHPPPPRPPPPFYKSLPFLWEKSETPEFFSHHFVIAEPVSGLRLIQRRFPD